MTSPHIRRLPPELRPLLDKFYRSQRSPMRSRSGDALWVAECGGLAAALCLRPLAEGLWLTGLLVARERRGQGLAGTLLHQALASHPEPIWLFCQPPLAPFYQRRGFVLCETLPATLAERLARYRRSKALLAMRAH